MKYTLSLYLTSFRIYLSHSEHSIGLSLFVSRLYFSKGFFDVLDIIKLSSKIAMLKGSFNKLLSFIKVETSNVLKSILLMESLQVSAIYKILLSWITIPDG